MNLPDMKKSLNLFISLMIISGIFVSCAGGGETVIVEDEPRRGESQSQQSEDAAEDTLSADFRDLRIGYVDDLSNLDPLFAESMAVFRTITLVYEGLFALDENGEPQPQLVSAFDISDDSLSYSFTIHGNVFFHDNPVFSAGVGRRLVSPDIKSAFERTASLNVPPAASGLFMNVEGYELFYNEQRNVYDPEKRVLAGVSGIQTPNDTTVIISLESPDPDFLTKLSSPYAVIYPGESVRSAERGLSQNPVGTGRYLLNRITEENNFILTRNDKYRSENEKGRFNRIDIKTYETEGRLFQEFAKNEVDIIPDPGPETVNQVLDEDGNLISAYRDLYKIIRDRGQRRGYFAFNSAYRGDLGPLHTRIENSENILDSIRIYGIEFDQNGSFEPEPGNVGLEDSYLAPFTENLYLRKILVDLSGALVEPQSQFQLMDVRTPSKFTAILANEMDKFHYERLVQIPEHPWFEYSADHFSIVHSYLTGYKTNGVSWWIDPAGIRVGNRQTSDS